MRYVVPVSPSDARVELYAADGARIFGTLTRPRAPGDVPAALLLSGSGPLDRNSNMPGQVLDVALALASALQARGIASLRYDKRGVGESHGDYLASGFDQETDDAVAALWALERMPGVDPDRLVVIGHSVGATIAIRLASRHDWFAGVVLLAAAYDSGLRVMQAQSRRIAASMRGLRRPLRRRFLRRQQRARQRLLASTEDSVRIGRTELPARWFREFMAYEPERDLPAIRCPVLAITGRNDIQVDPADVRRIGARVSGPFTGAMPEGLTHVLRVDVGRPSLRTYRSQLERPVDADLLDRVATWAVERCAARPP